MEGQDIIDVQKSGIMVTREPAEVLQEAKKAAQALMTIVSQKKKPVIMNGEQYLEFEDWQTAGRFYGLTVKVRQTAFLDMGNGVHGYEATADVLRTDGTVVSSADAMCLNDEEKWSTRAKYEFKDGKREKVGEVPVPLFQLRSMAQTRACAKALRNVLAWVVVLAGFKPTPAEEMTGNEVTNGTAVPQTTKPAVKTPEAITPAKAEATVADASKKTINPISVAQSKRLYAIAKSNGYTDDDIKNYLLINQGVERSLDIERENYDAAVALFQVKKANA